MSDYDYDIIIIGGGPAGATMARVAAQNGQSVMIYDKRKELGEPVRCGEGLGEREVVSQKIDIPKQCFSTEILGAKVIAPNGKSITWKSKDTKGWVLERKMFDKWLVELAVDKGAKVKTYARVTDLVKKDGKIDGVMVSQWGREPYEVRAPLVVSAEGMESIVARKAGLKAMSTLYDVDTCYQYEMKPYDHENLIELYFGTEIAPRGYVWIFPKAARKANVGIGIGGHLTNGKKGGNVEGADPKVLMDRFIENHPQLKDSSVLEDFGGVISVGAPIESFVKDGFMCIGTAARQVDPIHGGGIALAMETGIIAAGVAKKAHSAKDYSEKMLKEYENIWRAGPGKKMGKRLLLRKVMEEVNDDDLNHIFNTITDADLQKIMDGNFAGSVAKVVAGRPQLLRVLKALIA
ncbi:MAG: NAD(P)/FAD-dependent oxidoreductase [Candidatus Micrarchaeia archaeon]|jgi:digeranylgeranylglycerophospholipid reductase